MATQIIDLTDAQRQEIVTMLRNKLYEEGINAPMYIEHTLSDGIDVECEAEFFAIEHESGDDIHEEHCIWLTAVWVSLRNMLLFTADGDHRELPPWEVCRIQNLFNEDMEGRVVWC